MSVIQSWSQAFSFPCREDTAYEWYMQYAALKDTLSSRIKKEDKILVIGCGDSSWFCGSR